MSVFNPASYCTCPVRSCSPLSPCKGGEVRASRAVLSPPPQKKEQKWWTPVRLGLNSAPAGGQEVPSVTDQPASVDYQPLSVNRNSATQDLRLSPMEKRKERNISFLSDSPGLASRDLYGVVGRRNACLWDPGALGSRPAVELHAVPLLHSVGDVPVVVVLQLLLNLLLLFLVVWVDKLTHPVEVSVSQ